MTPYQEFRSLLSRWQWWYRFRRALNSAGYGALVGLMLALVIALIALFRGLILKDEFILLITAVTIACSISTATTACLWPHSELQIAQRLDHLFGLKERLSTALKLQKISLPSTATEMTVRQLADTISHAREIRPGQHWPIRLNRGVTLFAVILISAVTLAYVKGEAYFQQAQQKRIVQQAIAQEIEKLEALSEQIETNPNLTPEQREEILKPLNQALQNLRSAETLEQAVAALSQAEQELQALNPTQLQKHLQGLQAVGQSLQNQPSSPLQAVGQDLAEGDYLAAAEALQNLDVSSLSLAEQAALAEQLEEAAATLAESDPALAQQFSKAAQALQQGNPQAAQQALQQAAQALAQTGQQVAQAQAASNTAAQVGQSGQHLIQSGQSAESQQASGQGQGQGPGQGSSPQGGQGGGSSGSGQGTGGGDNTGGTAGESPIGQGNEPGDDSQIEYDQVYAPQHIGGQGGPDVQLPGSGEPGSEVTGQGSTSPGDPSQSTVPYIDVYANYAEAYRQAVESGQVPGYLQNIVQDYFTQLAP
jgi:hypothetical protein